MRLFVFAVAPIRFVKATRGNGAATVFSPDQKAPASRLSPWRPTHTKHLAGVNGEVGRGPDSAKDNRSTGKRDAAGVTSANSSASAGRSAGSGGALLGAALGAGPEASGASGTATGAEAAAGTAVAADKSVQALSAAEKSALLKRIIMVRNTV